MSKDDVDRKRRHFLTVATTVVGGVGAVATAIPFLSSMQPSARARAAGAPVELDISKLEPGAMTTVMYRGKPIAVVRRTADMLERLKALDSDKLRDPESREEQQPDYAANELRSRRPEILVVESRCTHLGCSPTFKPGEDAGLGEDWKGGFFCPCHGSKFDLAGRVYKNVPAPLNLAVPPHRYLDDNTLLIGKTEGVA